MTESEMLNLRLNDACIKLAMSMSSLNIDARIHVEREIREKRAKIIAQMSRNVAASK